MSKSSEILRLHLTRLLSTRDYPKTICPSEVARALTSSELSSLGYSEWREAMSAIRSIAANMRDRGEIEVLQKGKVLDGNLGEDMENVNGPIRLRSVQKQGN